MAGTNFHPVQPIVKAVETVGKPLVQNPHPAPGRCTLQQNLQETRNQRKTSTKNPRKNPTVRKTKNT